MGGLSSLFPLAFFFLGLGTGSRLPVPAFFEVDCGGGGNEDRSSIPSGVLGGMLGAGLGVESSVFCLHLAAFAF